MRSKDKQRNSIEPKGELASRTLAMPADSNPKGDIFDGWITSLMDSAGKNVGDPACLWTGGKRSGVEHHPSAPGACR
jgi:hypothetical protein